MPETRRGVTSSAEMTARVLDGLGTPNEAADADDTDEADDGAAPPGHWDEAARTTFRSLPAELQGELLRQEQARDDAHGAALEVLSQRHARAADDLGSLIDHARLLDPVIRDGLGTDWDKLAAEDPEGHRDKRQAFEARLTELRAAEAARQAHHASARERRIETERQRLAAKLPDAADPERRKDLAAKLAAALPQWGFAPDDLSRVDDHRLVLMALDAIAHRESQKAAETARSKKLADPPKPAPLHRAAPLGAEQAARAPRPTGLRDQVDSILQRLNEE